MHMFLEKRIQEDNTTHISDAVCCQFGISVDCQSDFLMVSAVIRAFWTLVHLKASCPKTLYQNNDYDKTPDSSSMLLLIGNFFCSILKRIQHKSLAVRLLQDPETQ